jgi:SHS2 domain-containing protein
VSYHLIDHTADIGIRVFGASAEVLFATAATALFDMITDRKNLARSQTRHLEVNGEDWADLMVCWLRELLYLWNAKQLLVKAVNIDQLSEKHLTASVAGEPFNPQKHIIDMEIKAVTYHQIDVTGGRTGWQATVIFDV